MENRFDLTVHEAAEKLYAWKAWAEARAGRVFDPASWLPTIDDLVGAERARWSWGPHDWAAATGAASIEGVRAILDGLGFPQARPQLPRPISGPAPDFGR